MSDATWPYSCKIEWIRGSSRIRALDCTAAWGDMMGRCMRMCSTGRLESDSIEEWCGVLFAPFPDRKALLFKKDERGNLRT